MSFKSWWNSWAPSWLDFADDADDDKFDKPSSDSNYSNGEDVTTGTGFSSSSGSTYSDKSQIGSDLDMAVLAGSSGSGYSSLAQLGLYGYQAYLANQNYRLNRDTLNFNKDMSEKQLAESIRQFDTNFNQSEYWNNVSQQNYLNQNQIAVSDMAKAGLNPLLAAGASSANNISPAQSSGVSGGQVSQIDASAYMSLVNSIAERFFERKENEKNRILERERMQSNEHIAEIAASASRYGSDTNRSIQDSYNEFLREQLEEAKSKNMQDFIIKNDSNDIRRQELADASNKWQSELGQRRYEASTKHNEWIQELAQRRSEWSNEHALNLHASQYKLSLEYNSLLLRNKELQVKVRQLDDAWKMFDRAQTETERKNAMEHSDRVMSDAVNIVGNSMRVGSNVASALILKGLK